MRTQINEMMHYNRHVLEAMILADRTDLEFVTFCIITMYRHYFGGECTDELIEYATEWAEAVIA